MFKKVINFFKKQNNLRYIAFGFLITILIGSGLLMIPGCIKPGQQVTYINALYTSTSAVCVTGLIAIDTYDTFTIWGQIIVLLLIQIGGLGVTTLGAGLILTLRRNVNLKERNLIQESLNVDDAKELLTLFKKVFKYTFIIEFIGACLSLITFAQHYPIGEAIWKSIFHSIASFNNSGFDIFGASALNMVKFQSDILLNLVTIILIILGGIGFLVMSDVIKCKGRFKKLTFQSKIVLVMTVSLLLIGMFALKLTEGSKITWLGAFFTSTSSRTAGFSTFQLKGFTKAGLLVVIILMFIGASPGSTGGGIKTTTLFVLIKGVQSMVTHKKAKAFKYSISSEAIKKSYTIFFLALSLILLSTGIVCILEPKIGFDEILFEMTSAYGTVGLSTGITPELTIGSKIISIVMMYIGRVGPLTFFSLWYSGKDELYEYSEGVVPIG